MQITAVSLRDFRNYERAIVEPAPGLTVLAGPNGAGKTNLLEAAYFGCTGRSPRTSNDRELIRSGCCVARVTTETSGSDGAHRIEIGFEPGEAKVITVDDAAAESLAASDARPFLSVFLPERLELLKGPPSGRRAHLDQFVAALWPARAVTRAAYGRALAQRNALLARIRAGSTGPAALGAWDTQLATHGAGLMANRAAAIDLLAPRFGELTARLGLPAAATVAYRPRSRARDAGALAAELEERRDADVLRGFTAHGPHRDDVALEHGGLALRAYGSQGQQRMALLALLFAERDVLGAERDRAPVMLLDDVMSELDEMRRELLVELLGDGGQAIVTTTDPGHVPGAAEGAALVLAVSAGCIGASAGREVA